MQSDFSWAPWAPKVARKCASYIGIPVVRRTVGRSVYGHVITKFSRMGSLPHFLTHGAPLKRHSQLNQLVLILLQCVQSSLSCSFSWRLWNFGYLQSFPIYNSLRIIQQWFEISASVRTWLLWSAKFLDFFLTAWSTVFLKVSFSLSYPFLSNLVTWVKRDVKVIDTGWWRVSGLRK